MNTSLKECKIDLIVIFISALILRSIFLIFFEGIEKNFQNDSLLYYKIAIFAHENGILNWQSHGRPPLISLILIPIFKIFSQDMWIIAVKILMVILSIFTCIAIYFLSLLVCNNTKISFFSSLLYSIYPFSIFSSTRLLSENLACLLICLICIFLIKFLNEKKFKSIVIVSFLMGLLSLSRSSYYYLPFLTIIFLLTLNIQISTKIKLSLTILLIFFSTLSPWILKNYIQLNEFVPTTTRLGIGLWYTNNDFSDPTIKKGGYNKYTQNFIKETNIAKLLDPIEESKYLKEKALNEIKKNKTGFVQATFFRFLNFFNPKPNPFQKFQKKDIIMILYYTPIIIIFFASIIDRKMNIKEKFLLLTIVYALITHLPFYGFPRFRLPIDSLIIILTMIYFFKDKKFASIAKFLSRLKNF